MKMVITAVPERVGYIAYLQEKLQNADWIIDNQKRGAMNSFLKALKTLDNDCGLLMQEDIILCENFETRVQEQIDLRPEYFINFYSMRNDDLTIGSRWDNNFIANLCFYIPKNHANAIIDWHRDYWVPSNYEGNMPTSASDLLVRSYLKKKLQQKYWIVIPNLVDHRIGKSAIDKRRSSKRISKTFKG